MRLFRIVGSTVLTCGCFLGIYEPYAGGAVAIIDERGALCADPSHRVGRKVWSAMARRPRPSTEAEQCAR
jgi:hypothetical protein